MKSRDIEKLLSLVEKSEPDSEETLTFLENPIPFLRFINRSFDKQIEVSNFQVLQPWAIAAIAARGASINGRSIIVHNDKSTPPAQFAAALGLNDFIAGEKPHGHVEQGRTIKLLDVCTYADIEPVSDQISSLIVSDSETSPSDEYIDPVEVKKVLRYVMIELLRNVIQHSWDRQGAVILAQRMDRGVNNSQPFVQVAVVDCGIGIPASLTKTHPEIESPDVALERSIWPYYSGKFHNFEQGAPQNAGLGLFFVSEMAKLTSGKMLIASQGASLLVLGDPENLGNNKITTFTEGFDGTLVAFEMPKRGTADYDALIRKITDVARLRTSRREAARWVRFDFPPEESLEFVINIASENTVKAEEFSKQQLIPRIRNGQTLVLNFVEMKICTQSYLHALLFEAIRVAFELKVPLYAKATTPSVADGIHLVEMYTLGAA